MSDSDVGDQYMFITILTIFSMSLIFHCSPQVNDSQSINVFLCLPLDKVSASSSSFAFDHPSQRNRFQLTLSHDVSHKSDLSLNNNSCALWSTSSFDTLSVHAICNICRINQISVASNCDFILWLTHTYQLVTTPALSYAPVPNQCMRCAHYDTKVWTKNCYKRFIGQLL